LTESDCKNNKNINNTNKKNNTKQDKKAEDEIDLFGEDDEPVEIQRKTAPKKDDKPKKKEKIEKTFVMLDIKPYDSEFDMSSLVPLIKKQINKPGLIWGEKFELKPVAFGIKKLVMSAV